jgi:hypothetical protein
MLEIDISKRNAIDENNNLRKCDYKCSFSFQYPDTLVTAINNSTQLTLKCDNYQNQPARFNGKSYNVNAIYLFAPSLHYFNTKKVNAELVIEHAPTNGGSYFYVCIPVLQTYNSNQPLADIVNQVSQRAQENNQSINFNKTDFTLQDIVPKKPYYFYEGVWGASTANFIVYDLSSAAGFDKGTMDNLTNTISPSSLTMMGSVLSYNPNGPDNKMKGDLYISCRPTNISKDTVQVTNQKVGSSSNGSSGMSTKTKEILMTSLIIIVTILLVVGFYFLAVKLIGKENITFSNPFKSSASNIG